MTVEELKALPEDVQKYIAGLKTQIEAMKLVINQRARLNSQKKCTCNQTPENCECYISDEEKHSGLFQLCGKVEQPDLSNQAWKDEIIKTARERGYGESTELKSARESELGKTTRTPTPPKEKS